MPTIPTHEAIERLRRAKPFAAGTSDMVPPASLVSMSDLSTLLSLLDQAREALRPFSDRAAEYKDRSYWGDKDIPAIGVAIRVGDLRKAAVLLAQMEKPS